MPSHTSKYRRRQASSSEESRSQLPSRFSISTSPDKPALSKKDMSLVLKFIQKKGNPQKLIKQTQTVHKNWRVKQTSNTSQKEDTIESYGNKTMEWRCSSTGRSGIEQQKNEDKRSILIGKKTMSKFVQKRQKFLAQFGYIKDRKAYNQSQNYTISVEPCIQDANERLYLSSVETAMIQNSMQRFKQCKHPFRRTNKGEKVRIMQEAEHQMQIEMSIHKHMECFENTKNTLKSVKCKQIKMNLSIKQITDNLEKCSNRIYGKKHQAQSVSWCTDILTAQIEQNDGLNIKKRRKGRSLNRTKRLLEMTNKIQLKTIDDF